MVTATATTSFDPATHTYVIGGRQVPSVTRVLRDLIPGWSASDWYLQRGRAVHACAAFVARGIEFDHDPRIAGEVAALRRFFAEVAPVPLAVELPVYSQPYQYAGTLDLLAAIAQQVAVIDFKASITPAVPYQLAAYALAYGKPQEIRVGYGVEIRADGTYRMTAPYDLRRYGREWLALLAAYHVRRACRVTETTGEETPHD